MKVMEIWKVWKRLCGSRRGTSLTPGLMRRRIRIYTYQTFEIVQEKKKERFQGRPAYQLKQKGRTNTNVVEDTEDVLVKKKEIQMPLWKSLKGK